MRALSLLAVAVLAAACTGAAKSDPPKSTASTTTIAAPAKPATPEPPAAPSTFPVVIKSDATGTVEAHFEGDAPPADLKVPLVFGTTRLFFTFRGSKTALVFTPKGELFFSDWRFDIFSPDGKYVLLLQDRFGPYHVVSVKNLPAYLEGKAQPDKVVTVPRAQTEQALVHSDAHWVSATEFEYTVGGETPEKKRATVP